MPEVDIGSSVVAELAGVIEAFSVDPVETDGAGASGEVSWQNTNWSQDYGYYTSIPEFKTAVDAKVTWVVGAGFEADEETQLLLGEVRGNGKDSFNSILKNLIKTKIISRDSFAEVIRSDSGVLVNLKPLDPSSIRIVQNVKGLIVRYEQVSKSKKVGKTFAPEEIFHLSHERVADEIKGTRIIDSLKTLIDMRNEAMQDFRRVMHRNVDPLWVFHLDTDDPAEIAVHKTKTDSARKKGENMYVPKGVVVPELMAVSANATLNPLAWIQLLNDYFFQAVNVPQIIIGNAKEFTDASAKIVYLAYEQSVKAEQLYVEEQVLAQLGVEIELTFPASLQEELLDDRSEDSKLQAQQPNDSVVELEGKA